MKQDELYEVIRLHELWLAFSPEGVRADLSGQDLSRLDLSNASLCYANLSSANLSYANLTEANLSEAYLPHANLSYAKLYDVDLDYANLSYANLSHAKLHKASLSYANLTGIEGKDIVKFNGGKHELIAADDSIQIGCTNLSKEDWLRDGYTIGRDNNYTEEEINRYLDFIRREL